MGASLILILYCQSIVKFELDYEEQPAVKRKEGQPALPGRGRGPLQRKQEAHLLAGGQQGKEHGAADEDSVGRPEVHRHGEITMPV